uniref:NADH-ubiquinone oxidoreductase chain 3 n=1 Tax=Ceratina okinawana TaxID=236018 RepID=A0A7U0M7Y1_9HYME|nr:NADH dehydrogenase subunit 3 [Ceratina okinawana]QQX27992.1 NADH dehydrogenase subunit 3 [Ceratina okinawana]
MIVMYMIYSILILIISLLIYLLNYSFSMIKSLSYEKNFFYECGFNPITKANLPFSLPFYMITLMFLIFDVEIILFLPLIMIIINLNLLISNLMILFINLLIIIMIFEWSMGFLKWLF